MKEMIVGGKLCSIEDGDNRSLQELENNMNDAIVRMGGTSALRTETVAVDPEIRAKQIKEAALKNRVVETDPIAEAHAKVAAILKQG